MKAKLLLTEAPMVFRLLWYRASKPTWVTRAHISSICAA
jgi:hypothetical protein